jgi:DNA-binding NarL/FixJ family response regulator
MIKVGIYDDSMARRESLEAIINLTPDYILSGSYSDCSSIVENTTLDQPNVILMDIEMPLCNGIEGVLIAKKHFPELKIIMQTAFDDDDKVFAALQAGAEGYILKSASVLQIIQSIDEVLKGGAVMTPSIALKVMRHFNLQQDVAHQDYNLSPKENEVLKHLAQGLSYKMIADSIGISYFTVNNHIKKIYEKLHVNSLGEAVALAHKSKLV